jgi:integrase
MKPLKVWIFRRKIPGKKRKCRYRLRWEEPIRDENGDVLLDDAGRPKLRHRQQTIQSTDKLTVEAEREKKYREINGLLLDDDEAEEEETPPVLLSDLTKMDEQWLTNRERSEGTVYLTLLAFRHFIEIGGDIPISEIGPEHIERFISLRKADVKTRTVNRQLRELRASFGRAVDTYRLLDRNPFTKIRLLTTSDKEVRVLSMEEERELLKACRGDPELDLFVRLALDTGARCNTIAYLMWAKLDLEERVGEVVCTERWKTKTRKSRPIAWSEETNERLKLWRLRRLGKTYVFAEENTRPRKFYESMKRRFDRAVEKAGIERCTPHDLRRTVGTRLAEAGVNEAVAAAYLGHADISTTVKFYQRIRKEVLKETVDRLRATGTTGHA